jgi:hypothetical protein
MKGVIWITAVIAMVAAATLAVARPAGAEKQFNRCPEDPSVNLPGPEICSFSFPVHVDLPAGTRCSFDVAIDYVLSGTIMFFENPPRAVAHTVGEGTATGNGHTLSRLSHFTETASPEIVFTDHGLFARYRLPGGRTVTSPVISETRSSRRSRRSSMGTRSTPRTPQHSAPLSRDGRLMPSIMGRAVPVLCTARQMRP